MNQRLLCLTGLCSILAFQGLGAETQHEHRHHVRAGSDGALTLRRGDRICIIGNTFAERMGRAGYFETLLLSRFPHLRLSLRNLGWSADTPSLRPRPLDFGDLHRHLAELEADVVLLCFGMSESFAGEAGLETYRRDLEALLREISSRHYNGKSPPISVLVSPIPHEKLGGDLPDPTAHNRELERYVSAMRESAEKLDTLFVDLYHPLAPIMADPAVPPLTFNGIHLSEFGDWVTAGVLMEALGFEVRGWSLELDAETGDREIDGLSTADVDFSKTGVSMKLIDPGLAMPPVPGGRSVPARLDDLSTRARFRNLEPGNYSLRIQDRALFTASAETWARGVDLSASSLHEPAALLRETVNAKNQQFFLRFRAVNAAYIFGQRKKPFGVNTYPIEMLQYAQRERELEYEIWKLADLPPVQKLELARVSLKK